MLHIASSLVLSFLVNNLYHLYLTGLFVCRITLSTEPVVDLIGTIDGIACVVVVIAVIIHSIRTVAIKRIFFIRYSFRK